jgi:lipoprotein-anchoring transpeptidase ErfK/SrfK
MPYMQRLTWYGIALHAGRLPGYPASHGCIRLPRKFAKKLYGITDFSTEVTVTGKRPKSATAALRIAERNS